MDVNSMQSYVRKILKKNLGVFVCVYNGESDRLFRSSIKNAIMKIQIINNMVFNKLLVQCGYCGDYVGGIICFIENEEGYNDQIVDDILKLENLKVIGFLNSEMLLMGIKFFGYKQQLNYKLVVLLFLQLIIYKKLYELKILKNANDKSIV